MKSNPTTGKYAYPMGIAVGDYDNNGFLDFFFSNTGSSVPEFLARGDLAEEDTFIKEWMLFKNSGNFNFSDAAKATKVADFEFSWGAILKISIWMDDKILSLQKIMLTSLHINYSNYLGGF